MDEEFEKKLVAELLDLVKQLASIYVRVTALYAIADMKLASKSTDAAEEPNRSTQN